MTAIIDYGVGNLFSLCSSFAKIGEEAEVTSDPAVIEKADRVILPGVGAFADAAKKLKDSGLDRALFCAVERKKPVMGICLGMQLLFSLSEEYGTHAGLGLLDGRVVAIPSDGGRLKIPHMGWNALHITQPHPLFKYVREGACVYFVHSYYAVCDDSVKIATAEYGADLTAAVAKGNLMGCQFHPEKSGDVGLAILRAFAEMKGNGLC